MNINLTQILKLYLLAWFTIILILNFVPKRLNPPNVPQARPIENFWDCLWRQVYEGDWEADTDQLLIGRIESKMKEFDTNFVESLLGGGGQSKSQI